MLYNSGDRRAAAKQFNLFESTAKKFNIKITDPEVPVCEHM